MTRRDQVEQVIVFRTINGYVIDTSNPMKGGSVADKTMYSFESLGSMTKWFEENFSEKS